jgi:hypothetical protein
VHRGTHGKLSVLLNNPGPAASGIYRLFPVAVDPMKLMHKPVLTMALAQKMAMACVKDQLDTRGPPVDIAIYDDGGEVDLLCGDRWAVERHGADGDAEGEGGEFGEVCGVGKRDPGVEFVPAKTVNVQPRLSPHPIYQAAS